MSWKPITDKHAIERVRFTIVFQEPLTQKTFDELTLSFKETHLKDYDLNKHIKGKKLGVTISLSNNMVQNTEQEPENPIHQFQKTANSDETSVLKRLSIARDEVSFEILNYTRWINFYETVQKLIKQTTDITIKTVDISKLSLDYWDKFVFEGDPSNADPRLLLKNLEQHLPENVFTDGELWHLTKGWFKSTDDINDKILVNLNWLAQNEEEKNTKEIRRTVQIHTLTAFRKIYSENSAGDVVKDTEKLHNVSKSVFADGLLDEVKMSVGL